MQALVTRKISDDIEKTMSGLVSAAEQLYLQETPSSSRLGYIPFT